ncbi:flavodoxin family protein [Streptomyces sp. B-S-A8]|uniref:Flavodoxin family protein n=1 Tax=Streptomyces solicavernae TaxID=3043614 RepID=A0ABT6RYR8_9ACTN|nr:flavodoxin family protein [Streptomyces sp. B-S-A8]MDI3389577.1 flavodoxin family protein [Streptomyces sp. B-S-A8]
MTPRVVVVHHSRHGTVRALAVRAAEGARAGGARVRLLTVADEERGGGARWPEQVAAAEDVLWADGLVLAAPTYFGNVSSPFKRFLETTSPLWRQGALADRVVTAMTASASTHGGREATLLALHQSAYHWGSWVVGADPADPLMQRAGGNAYGLSAEARTGGGASAGETTAAFTQGRRLAELTALTHPGTGERTDAGAGTDEPVKVAVVHCADGAAARLLAQECAAGARLAGAQVRLRRVPGAGVARTPWLPGAAAVATAEDIAWADAVVFGAPARLGAMAAELLGFAQSLEYGAGAGAGGTLRGVLSGKPVSAFTVAPRTHAGSESALLAFHHVLLHSGAVVVPPGFTDPSVAAAGGNPYGTTQVTDTGMVASAAALAAAAHQGRRTATAGRLLRRAWQPAYGTHDLTGVNGAGGALAVAGAEDGTERRGGRHGERAAV